MHPLGQKISTNYHGGMNLLDRTVSADYNSGMYLLGQNVTIHDRWMHPLDQNVSTMMRGHISKHLMCDANLHLRNPNRPPTQVAFQVSLRLRGPTQQHMRASLHF